MRLISRDKASVIPASLAIIPQEFYARNTLVVAKALLGTLLVRQLDGGTLVSRIVETEAYLADDPACHAYANNQRLKLGKMPSGRSAILFGMPGVSYVYLNYGVYYLFNIVTEKNGVAGAVLIRAIEPLLGIETMRKLRPQARSEEALGNGPGKLALAMSIGLMQNGHPIYEAGDLVVAYPQKKLDSRQIVTATRIGISKGKDLPWRFYIKGNAYISKASR